MSEEKNLAEKIRENALNPKSAEVDGQKVEQHSLKDQLAVAKYLDGKAAVSSPNSGLKITKLQHSGA